MSKYEIAIWMDEKFFLRPERDREREREEIGGYDRRI